MLSVFIALSILTIVSCLLAILSRIPVYSLLSVVVAFFSIAGHFLLLQSQFLAAVQVIVYAGAIVVLFLFTIMLMNLNIPLFNKKSSVFVLTSTVVCAGILGLFIHFIHESVFEPAKLNANTGDVKTLGKVLLNEYYFPFEFISVLLLTTMIGAVLISKKESVSN